MYTSYLGLESPVVNDSMTLDSRVQQCCRPRSGKDWPSKAVVSKLKLDGLTLSMG